MENVVVEFEDDGKNRHGYPRGYHYAPESVELIDVLEDKLASIPLLYPLPNIFHDVKILNFHPAALYKAHKKHEEAGYIYFFSRRKFRGNQRARPVRATKDGNWKASGHGELVTRNGVNVGYKNTMVFYQKNNKKKDDKTDWAMHEYTSITGPNNQVADLALYRLYNKEEKRKKNEASHCSSKKKRRSNESGQHVFTLSNCSPKSEELPSPPPTAGGTSTPSTSQAQAQASVGHPDDYYHQYALAAAPLMAPSLPATPVKNWPHIADWENKLPSLPPLPAPSTVSGPAAVGHNLPASQQQDAEYPEPADSNELPLKMLPPPTLPAPDSGDCLEDEFNWWCEMQQKQPATSTCSVPTLDPDDLPMLMDEDDQLDAYTLEELLGIGPRHDDAVMSIEEADLDDQV